MHSFRQVPIIGALLVLGTLLAIDCSRPGSHPGGTIAATDTAGVVDSASAQSHAAKPVSLSYDQRLGKVLYKKYCAICHGDAGKGDGFNAYSLDPKPRDFTDAKAMAGMDDATLRATIVGGGKGVNKSPLMPAWGGRMNSLEIEYVLEYVKNLEQQN